MSKYRKAFLKRFSEIWLTRFPTWKPGANLPVFWAKRDAIFSDSLSFQSYRLFFHLIIEFTSKSPGQFTGDIIITSSAEGYPHDCNPPHRFGNHISKLEEGAYRIGAFIRGEDIWWHLVDEEAESKRFLASIPNAPKTGYLKRREGDWYASDYDVSLDFVICEAVEHFCASFENHVLPKLNNRR